MGKPRDAVPRWLWGPLPGIGVRSGLKPQESDCQGETQQELRAGGCGRPGEEGPWSPGVRGACSSKAGDRTSLQSRGLCSRTQGLVGAQSLMTA